jgi:hypothetical protein
VWFMPENQSNLHVFFERPSLVTFVKWGDSGIIVFNSQPIGLLQLITNVRFVRNIFTGHFTHLQFQNAQCDHNKAFGFPLWENLLLTLSCSTALVFNILLWITARLFHLSLVIWYLVFETVQMLHVFTYL